MPLRRYPVEPPAERSAEPPDRSSGVGGMVAVLVVPARAATALAATVAAGTLAVAALAVRTGEAGGELV